MKKILFILIVVACLPLQAKKADPKDIVDLEGSSLISFNSWKNEQVILNRNQIARLKNWIYFVKQGRVLETIDPVSKDKINLSSLPLSEKSERLQRAESRLKQVEKDLEIAEELSFEDYLAVYVSHLGKNKDKLKLLAAKMTEEEVVELLIYIQRYNQSIENNSADQKAKRSAAPSLLNY